MEKKKILVGLSGGVDSAVSALLLKEQGYEVACGFMINYLDEENSGSCPTKADLEEAQKVAGFLGLPFYTFDYREEYEKRIVDYIYREYEAGRTPNPDVFCNNLVKFDLFLEEALHLGFDGIATGHYARIGEQISVNLGNPPVRGDIGGIVSGEVILSPPAPPHRGAPKRNFQLLKGVDPSKDQSYFLSRLSEFQLSKALFPIGHLLKSEVREIARKANLPNAERKDSQGLCFIGKVSMKEFLERKIPKKPGNILDTAGNIVGQHEGAFSYTIGQRRGIKVGGGPALFVVAKDTKANTITVGNEDELALFSSTCALTNWIGQIPEEGKAYGAKIRYRQEDQTVTMRYEIGDMISKNPPVRGESSSVPMTSQGGFVSENKIYLQFIIPQRAITPGQICVVYDGDIVVGSGIIK